jgi:hypothetical protein
VLLKNGKNGDLLLLPFNKDANKVLVVGAHANDYNVVGGPSVPCCKTMLYDNE